MNTLKDIFKKLQTFFNKDYNHYQDIDQITKNDQLKQELIDKISFNTWLSEHEIETYSESQVLDSCNESSTVKCQLHLLYNLSTNEYLRKQMELFVTRKKETDILNRRMDAEYMTALYHLKKNISFSKSIQTRSYIDVFELSKKNIYYII
jgi:hypothetical protein